MDYLSEYSFAAFGIGFALGKLTDLDTDDFDKHINAAMPNDTFLFSLANGVPMKQIQEWLGHSDFSTTANIYAHLDYTSKLSSADALVNGLSDALSVYQ